MLREIETKISETKKALRQIDYELADVSAKEFHDYLTGEVFSEDTTTLHDVLGSEYLMVHELIEISELKKMGKTIDKRVLVESPKIAVYTAHFMAMERELDYALLKKDYFWIKIRLKHHFLILTDDPHLPEEMRRRGEAIMEKFQKILNHDEQP